MSFYKKITKNVDIVLSIIVLIIICVFVYKNSREYAEGDSEEKPEEKPEEKSEEKPRCEYPDDLWIEEKDGQCVVAYDDLTVIPCELPGSPDDGGDSPGVRVSVNKSLTPDTCPTKTRQNKCGPEKCPIDCEGKWSDWGDCIEKPCGEQPSESRFYEITFPGQAGGKPCKFENTQEQKRKCGEIVKCDA